MAPSTTKQWTLNETKGFDSLHLNEAAIPPLRERDVLVRFHYASLNFRDLIIAKARQLSPRWCVAVRLM